MVFIPSNLISLTFVERMQDRTFFQHKNMPTIRVK